jgi:hypothetical protein
VPSITMVARLLDLADQLSCASVLLPSIDRNSEIYERVYRALDHGPLKIAFTTKGSPLKDRETLRKIGALVVPLQSERHRADYLPPKKNIFSRDEAKKLIDQARRAVSEIEGLGNDDRIAPATILLFKSRSP